MTTNPHRNTFELEKFSEGSTVEVRVAEGGKAAFRVLNQSPTPMIDLKMLPEGKVDGPSMKLFGSIVLNPLANQEELESGLLVVGGKLAVGASPLMSEHRHIAIPGTIESVALVNRR